jgi:glycine/D-amino acid oxidase-like deaminating enzyme
LEPSHLVDRFGADEAKRLWEFVNRGVDLIRQTVKRLQICCALQPQDSLFIANNPSGMQNVEEEKAARTRLGYASLLYQRDQVASVIGSDQYYGAVRYGDTFAITPFVFCRAVAIALETQGVSIYENTELTAIGSGCVHAGPYRIRAPRIAVCTDCSVPAGLPVAAGSVRPIQTFIALTRPLTDAEVVRLFPDGPQMVWDTDLIYQYFRLADENRLLIGAGRLRSTYARREAATPPQVLRKMRRYLRQKFPWLSADLEFTWPGRIGVTRDFMPISDCGSAEVCTVLAATGLPWAAALGQQVAEQLLNVADRNDCTFSSRRAFPWPSKLQWAIGKSAACGFGRFWIPQRRVWPNLVLRVRLRSDLGSYRTHDLSACNSCR